MSHRKNDNFKKITGKNRFKIENTIKRNISKISKEFLIDVEEKKILKVKGNKIFIVKSINEEIFI